MNTPTGMSGTLLELTFADALERIAAADELPPSKRTHWMCSLRKAAEWMQKEPRAVPARWIAIRIAVGSLHHEPLGVVASPLANHKSNVKAALSWFAGEANVPR